ncbi:hypothetical protein [Neorhodopirellula pilleata]|uniref:hypothetical protein n=1 Tax=Neorhodopirellula pilleata TaxID=2714738 RepID=UPI0011B5A96C|nr:hypothetical protein [Neorhodopirellula pilleata]
MASRRRELQSGCPFELVIEHVQPLDEKQAIEHERRYRSLFRTMEQRISQVTENSSSTNKKRLTRWFPFTGEIEAFVVQLKEGELPNTALASDPQALLF